MRILNLMFSPGLGGIEQVFADYAALLTAQGAAVRSAVRANAATIPLLNESATPYTALPLLGAWDPLAIWRLNRLIRRFGPDAIICHGNRALQLAHRAAGRSTIKLAKGRNPVKLVFVTHNHRLQHIHLADAVLTITARLAGEAVAAGIPESAVFHVPNSIDCTHMAPPRVVFRSPPVIGAMGRMVHKKGFHILLQALALLRERGVGFRAVLGGNGEEYEALSRQLQALELADHLTLTGWVADKQAFFEGVDVFCLPSLHEPFGVVALEAMRAGVPIVSTASEGPSEILEDGHTALLCPIDDAEALANALQQAITNPAASRQWAIHAQAVLEARYGQAVVGTALYTALQRICGPKH